MNQNNSKKILVVEDDPIISAMTCKFLQKKGYDVALKVDGVLALDYLKDSERLPNLILTDIMMPNMDGLELLKQIKTNNYYNQIPIFAITAMEEEQLKLKEGFKFDSIFLKPFSLSELVNKIEQFI